MLLLILIAVVISLLWIFDRSASSAPSEEPSDTVGGHWKSSDVGIDTSGY